MRRRRMYVCGKRLQRGSTHSSSALQQRRTDGRRHTRETAETGACDYTGRSWKGRRSVGYPGGSSSGCLTSSIVDSVATSTNKQGISPSRFLRSFGGTKRLVHSAFFSPLYFELVMMDTNHSTRTPIPEIYILRVPSTSMYAIKREMLVERGKFRTTETYFLEWSVDDGMFC